MIKFLLISILSLLSIVANAATYYVSNSTNTDGGGSYTCSDSNAGTSATAPWCTVSKVNSTTFTTGDDVYFRAGGTWGPSSSELLQIDWDGTDGNRVVVGSYYMSGGAAVVGALPDPYSTYDQKPKFLGNYSENKTGAFLGTAAAIPSNVNYGLVRVDGDYVTLQNIIIKNSAGEGIDVMNIGGGGRANHHHAIVENNEIYYTAKSLIVLERLTTDIIVRNNVVGAGGQGHLNSDISGSWPGGITFTNSDRGLAEGNYVYNSNTEGISAYAGTKYTMIRGNIVVGSRSGCVYIDGSSYTLVESNYCIGPVNTVTVGSIDNNYPTAVGGININIEDSNTAAETTINNVIRNNILIGTLECLKIKLDTGWAAADTLDVGGYFYGNTCIDQKKAGMHIGDTGVADNDITQLEIMRNIFMSPEPIAAHGTAASRICFVTGSVTSAAITVDDNLWETNPSASACDDADDEYGTPDFFQNVFTGYTNTNYPTDIDFELQTGSVGKDTGGAISTSLSSWLNTTNFPQYVSMATPCSTFDTTKMSYDFNCVARNASSEKGAIDGITSITPTVTVPYKMKIGGAASGWDNEVTAYRVVGTCTSFTNSTATAISGNITYADDVFQSWRGCNGSLSYEIPIANASYKVTLPFTEPYWGVTSGTCGARKFDLYVENTLIADELDICMLANNVSLAAVEYAINSVTVSDGYLSVRVDKGTTGTDNTPLLFGISVETATADTVTIGTSTVSQTLNNSYPLVNTLDPVSLCSATTSLTSVYTSSINTAGLTSGTAEINGTVVEYTPANGSTTGSVGSFVATISDGSDTATCTISLTLSRVPYVTFKVTGTNESGQVVAITSSSGWCWDAMLTTSEYNLSTTKYYNSACDETTDSNGVMNIPIASATVGDSVLVRLYNPNSVTVGTRARVRRTYSIITGVKQ